MYNFVQTVDQLEPTANANIIFFPRTFCSIFEAANARTWAFDSFLPIPVLSSDLNIVSLGSDD